ncbi:ABC transporter ATP-binding protein [Kitasatospora sp. CB01950]|uniref:ABC transporter ATP-binding protein n=1 Tax=Kitasatospora sp. CB01950 TaxID=1703930 RepID=UPI000939B106|nr:ABC transporter ATP-binding protein [Kitasatospora sp. CB01950]OKI99241.1 ABC transporter [Kitasatospora sp. CB01950]
MEISLQGLTKEFKGSFRALDHLDLELRGGMVGLLGANGAGKTTLMRILTGTVQATSGRVVVGGHDLGTTAGRTAVKRTLGYLPQEIDMYPDLTAREFLDYIALLKGIDSKSARRAQISELLERVALTEAAGRRVGGYSGGMKRRLGIAQALLGDPGLIIVDEPTAGLDPEERMRFRALLAGLGGDRTVILSTHILDDVAQTCPEVAVLTKGRLVYHGSTEGVVAAAHGYTYTVTTAGPPPVGDHAVVNAQATPGGTVYRVVTEVPPAGAVPVEPTLEDGYVALMRRGRSAQGVA